jgi:hypothetical protein
MRTVADAGMAELQRVSKGREPDGIEVFNKLGTIIEGGQLQ